MHLLNLVTRLNHMCFDMPEVSTCTVYAYALHIFAICTGLRAYDVIFTDIYDFCRFKLIIIPRFIFKLFAVTPAMLREHESK